MKKVMTSIVALIMLCCFVLTSGCNLTPEQVKVISQNAGLFAAVGWIAYDNPDASAIESVKSVLSTIEKKGEAVEAGKTYTEVIYPELVKVIDKDVKLQDRPLCKAASLTLLNGLDTLFAMHPEWKKDQDIAIDVVKAFIMGAKNGLNLSEDHEVIKQARASAAKRAKIYRP
jgi:hypothetical protein